MIRYVVALSLIMAISAACSGCGAAPLGRVETFPVTGTLLVDGEPVEAIAVRCVRLSDAAKTNPIDSQCFTMKDGTFKIGTYEANDGVPEGEYVLTFQWGEWNVFSRAYEGDKLNERYRDPAKSTVKVTVVKGKPTDLGKIAITTH